jgi:hypothetical protein
MEPTLRKSVLISKLLCLVNNKNNSRQGSNGTIGKESFCSGKLNFSWQWRTLVEHLIQLTLMRKHKMILVEHLLKVLAI